MASEDRFGYEWQRYSTIFPEYENQFNNWISPLKSKDLLEKKEVINLEKLNILVKLGNLDNVEVWEIIGIRK